MLVDLTANANLRGNCIDLEWNWIAPGANRPDLRLVRRQRTYPADAGDGLCVFDLVDLFAPDHQPWARIARLAYLVTNSNAEGGLLQAEVKLYFDTPDATTPVQIGVTYFDGTKMETITPELKAITRITRTSASDATWTTIETAEVFVDSGGGVETSLGQFVTYTDNRDGKTPNRLEWTAGPSIVGQLAMSVDFDQCELQYTQQTLMASTAERSQTRFTIFRTDDNENQTLNLNTPHSDFGDALRTAVAHQVELRSVEIDEQLDENTGDWRRAVRLQDKGLLSETAYYYALYIFDGTTWHTDVEWRVSALATGDYGLDDRLYQLLPGVHQRYDEPTPAESPAERGRGPLRNYLSVMGAALDQTRSLAESLRDRHAVLTVRDDALLPLAHWIGWEPDQTLEVQTQRNDILFAPDVYATIGTLPNIRALVNRITSWNCELKEFVHNVFLTNAPETIRLWEIWEWRHDGKEWDKALPRRMTTTEGFDGRPALAQDNAADTVWLFWHSDRNGRREIWLQRLGIDTDPQRAMLGAPDDTANAAYVDEYPAAVAVDKEVWLFWDSNRDGHWDIWARTFAGLPGSAPVQITDHLADDRHPAALRDANGHMWIFWESNRRGPTDIWAKTFDGKTWGPPTRLTTSPFRDEMPAAVLDANNHIWLFWCRDLGDRRHLFTQVFDGKTWGKEVDITTGLQRDESPAAVLWNKEMWLFWNSDREGHWQIWGQVHDGTAWRTPAAIMPYMADDKEPAVLIDRALGVLRLMWRSQRRGNGYKSRTLDFNDTEMLKAMRRLADRAHYTYDTGLNEEDWYARGTVGVVLPPDTNVSSDVERQIVDRARTFVEPFRPLPTRFVWLKKSAGDTDPLEEAEHG